MRFHALLLLASTSFGVSYPGVLPTSSDVRVFDQSGRPLAGAVVYSSSPWPEGGYAELDGTTDSKGRVKNSLHESDAYLFALSKDGRLTIAPNGPSIPFKKTADVDLTFLDSHGTPLGNRWVSIFPRTDRSPLRNSGDLRFGPEIPDALNRFFLGKTDDRGHVRMKGMTMDIPFSACIDVGMTANLCLDGAVWSGKPATIRIPMNLRIAGRVTHKDSGKPAAGIKLELSETVAYHMFGYGPTVQRSVTTDSNGRYEIAHLPASWFILSIKADAVGFQTSDKSRPLAGGVVNLAKGSINVNYQVP